MDTFRKEYTPLTEDQKKKINDLKMKAQELFDSMEMEEPSREMSLAKTNLEQSIMWAVKALTAKGGDNNGQQPK